MAAIHPDAQFLVGSVAVQRRKCALHYVRKLKWRPRKRRRAGAARRAPARRAHRLNLGSWRERRCQPPARLQRRCVSSARAKQPARASGAADVRRLPRTAKSARRCVACGGSDDGSDDAEHGEPGSKGQQHGAVRGAVHNRRAAVELRRQRSRRPQAHASAYNAAGRAVAVLAARSTCHKAARGDACTGSKRARFLHATRGTTPRLSASLSLASPLHVARCRRVSRTAGSVCRPTRLFSALCKMQVALSRAGATRCCASQGAAATQTHASPQAGAALARRRALCAGAALTLGVQPRRASAAPAFTFTSAAGLEYYDDKVGAGEEAAAGDVVKILYSAHTVNADGESLRPCSAPARCSHSLHTQASWATSSTPMAAQAPAPARRTKSRWAIPTRTSR